MISLLVAFFVSFGVSILIIRTQNLHGRLSGDVNFDGPQKFHSRAVPRVGGIAIGLAIFSAIIFHFQENTANFQGLFLLTSTLPAFGIGIAEDLTKK